MPSLFFLATALAGGLALLIGLALTFDLVSLRHLAVARDLPGAGLILRTRQRLPADTAHELEAALAGFGCLLVSFGVLFVLLSALFARPRSQPLRAGRALVITAGGLLYPVLLLLSLYLMGIWPEPPGHDLLDSLLRQTTRLARAVLRRAF